MAISQNKNREYNTFLDGESVTFEDTDIAFSPNIIAGNMIRIQPVENLQINVLTKYVGEQYMSNYEVEASKLEDYTTTDLNIQYIWQNAPLFKEVIFTGLVNNIFDEEYISNGYYYTYDIPNDDGSTTTYDGAGYYPQATINFLVGITLRF